MPRQQISKFLKQMKFMRRTRAEEIDKEQSEQTLLAPTNDEYWVLDIPGLENFQPTEETNSCNLPFNQCMTLRFGRLSANGQNPQLEALLEKKKEDEKMKEFDDLINDSLITEEEMLESYLSHARRSIKSIGEKNVPKKIKVEPDDDQPEDAENEAEPSLDNQEQTPTIVKSIRRKETDQQPKGGVIKKRSKFFTGFNRKTKTFGMNRKIKQAKAAGIKKKFGVRG